VTFEMQNQVSIAKNQDKKGYGKEKRNSKGMTAPKPVATSMRAKLGQPVDCNWLKRMEPE
jgi:hypothetical protein